MFLAAAIAYEYLSEMPAWQRGAAAAPMPTDASLRDEDVLAEEARVASGAADATSVILVKDVKKVRPSPIYSPCLTPSLNFIKPSPMGGSPSNPSSDPRI